MQHMSAVSIDTEIATLETASCSGGSHPLRNLRGVRWRIDLGILPSYPCASVDGLRRVTADSRRRYIYMYSMAPSCKYLFLCFFHFSSDCFNLRPSIEEIMPCVTVFGRWSSSFGPFGVYLFSPILLFVS